MVEVRIFRAFAMIPSGEHNYLKIAMIFYILLKLKAELKKASKKFYSHWAYEHRYPF